MSHIIQGGTYLFCAKKIQNQLHSPQKRIPRLIASALSILQSSQQVSSLSRSTRDVLAYLVKLTDLSDPQISIFAFKRTIASNTLLSESSVYRALNKLVKDGYIEREKQERKSRNGRLSCARIRLSNILCHALGLCSENINSEYPAEEAKSVLKDKKREPNILSPSVNLTDGYIATNRVLQSLQKHSSKSYKTSSSQKTNPYPLKTRVPEELLWLIEEKNVSKPQIFLLMKEFSKRKQRLSDAVELIKDRIKQLPNSDIFKYLRALAKSPTDFAWIRKRHENEKLALEKNNAKKSDRDQLLATRNRHFLRSEKAVHQIDATVKMAQVWFIDKNTQRLKTGYIPISNDYIELIQTGRLQSIDADQAKDLIERWQSS